MKEFFASPPSPQNLALSIWRKLYTKYYYYLDLGRVNQQRHSYVCVNKLEKCRLHGYNV